MSQITLKERIDEIDKILTVITEGRILELNIINNLEVVLRDDYKFKIEKLPDNELKKHYEGLLEKLGSARTDLKIRELTCPNCKMIFSHPDEFLDLDDAQEIGYRKGLIAGKKIQKENDLSKFIKDIKSMKDIFTEFPVLYEQWLKKWVDCGTESKVG